MTKVFVRMAQLLFPGYCIFCLLVHLRLVLARHRAFSLAFSYPPGPHLGAESIEGCDIAIMPREPRCLMQIRI